VSQMQPHPTQDRPAQPGAARAPGRAARTPAIPLRAELLMLRSTPGPWVVLGLLVAFVGVTSFMVPTAAPSDAPLLRDPEAQRTLFGLRSEVALFAILLGGLVGATDHRHGTIATRLLATPVRWRVGAARVVTVTMGALVLALVAVATMLAVAVPAVQAAGGELAVPAGELARLWVLGAAGMVGLALFGYGIGEATRSQIVGLGALLVLTLIVEPLLGAAVPAVADFLPTAPLAILAGLRAAQISAAGAGALIMAYAAVPTAVGLGILLRHDIG